MFLGVDLILQHKLDWFLMSSWMSIMMWGVCAMSSILGTLELHILDGIHEGLSDIQKFLCGI